MIVNGTTYNDATDPNLVQVLERLRQNHAPVVRCHYGDAQTGELWGDVEIGSIGRSTGQVKIPLSVPRRSDGGPGLLEHCILLVDTDSKNPTVLYRHPKMTGTNYCPDCKQLRCNCRQCKCEKGRKTGLPVPVKAK